MIGRILLAGMLLVAGCDKRPDQWDAFVYPDRENMERVETYRGFKTFELCQEAAIGRLRILRDPDGGDYECGYKCAPDESMGGLNVCKETKK
jgi:hypothetical protein